MAEQFYTILTNIGKAKIANAISTGTKVNLTTLKVGDSNGAYYNPSEMQTDLIHPLYECNVTGVKIDGNNPNWITITGVIPSDVGGFSITEVGLFDDTNSLIAIGKYPQTYKPIASNGSTKELYIKMTLEVVNAESVELKLDPTILIATKEDIANIDTKIDNEIEKVNIQLKQMSNPNLLINGDFQVWQRGIGFSNVTVNPMYTADRWRVSSDGNMEVKQQNYGVSIEVTKTGSYHNFEQYIELPQYLKGKKVTLSIKLYSKGVIQQLYAGVKNSTLSGDKSLEGVFNSTKTDLFTYTFTIPTGDYAFLYIGVQTEEKVGAKLEVEYIKLELGEIATPFIHLLYCEELALCQRYYEIVRFHGRVAKGMNELVSSIPFKVTKRIIPTNKNLVSSVYDTSVGWISKVANVSDFSSVECCYFNIGSTNVIMDVHVTASSDSDIY